MVTVSPSPRRGEGLGMGYSVSITLTVSITLSGLWLTTLPPLIPHAYGVGHSPAPKGVPLHSRGRKKDTPYRHLATPTISYYSALSCKVRTTNCPEYKACEGYA